MLFMQHFLVSVPSLCVFFVLLKIHLVVTKLPPPAAAALEERVFEEKERKQLELLKSDFGEVTCNEVPAETVLMTAIPSAVVVPMSSLALASHLPSASEAMSGSPMPSNSPFPTTAPVGTSMVANQDFNQDMLSLRNRRLSLTPADPTGQLHLRFL